MQKNIKEIILHELDNRFPGYSFAFLHGTYGSEKLGPITPKSDIDLIIVYEAHVKPFRQLFEASGLMFDVFVYDAESLNNKIRRSTSGISPTLIMINEAQVLPAPNPLSDYLKEVSKVITAIPKAPAETESVRLVITNTLDDLEFAATDAERNMLIIELYKLLVDLVLTVAGRRGHIRRHAVNALNDCAPNFLEELNKALFASQAYHDTRPLIELASRTLDEHGGRIGDGYMMPLASWYRTPIFNLQLTAMIAQHALDREAALRDPNTPIVMLNQAEGEAEGAAADAGMNEF